ncbi:MAG: hypothetical protein FD153_319 [Rhodospirillaceae bacterium]|nr:MAG: hypothetical protein FD153_319 [Rhodospirillaceae bacterium]
MQTSLFLPHFNAILNGVTAALLLTGFVLIRQGRRHGHRLVMLAAIVVSILFLASYLVYHFTAPILVFPAEGWVRPVYYTIMITHIILAMGVTPLVAMTAGRALRGRFDRHRALARWTLPVWLYVSVTGLVIYGMLYHVYA